MSAYLYCEWERLDGTLRTSCDGAVDRLPEEGKPRSRLQRSVGGACSLGARGTSNERVRASDGVREQPWQKGRAWSVGRARREAIAATTRWLALVMSDWKRDGGGSEKATY